MNINFIKDEEFSIYQKLIFELTGISLDSHKKNLVDNRLASRLRFHSIPNYTEYYNFILKIENSKEKQIFIDLITTNETSFFREIIHFDFLLQEILPNYKSNSNLRVWSAASSSGEEAYSTAMVLENFYNSNKYEIFGTDISHRILEKSKNALYPIDKTSKIPLKLLKKYCLKGKGDMEGFFKISNQLTSNVQFKYMNLNEPFPNIGNFDVIFLRNVMIYFNQETRDSLIQRISKHLNKGGHLFIGQSETIIKRYPFLEMQRPSIYRKI